MLPAGGIVFASLSKRLNGFFSSQIRCQPSFLPSSKGQRTVNIVVNVIVFFVLDGNFFPRFDY